MTCRRRPKASRERLQKAWANLVKNSGMPPGFWRLSPQPPWPTLTILPLGWREYTHTDNTTLLVADGGGKHEFIPPSPDAVRASPGALALIQALWVSSDPAHVIQDLEFPSLVPSPALAALLDSPREALLSFTASVAGRKRQREELVVHHTWHRYFRRLARMDRTVVLQELGEATLDRVLILQNRAQLDFLLHPAQPTPTWEQALELGEEETVIFGNLGPHSQVYPVDASDVLAIRDVLRQGRIND